MQKTAYLFPGQGAQHVGMCKELCANNSGADAIFDRAEAISGLPVKKLCFEGPEEELANTANAQPCIFAASAALLAVVKDFISKPDICAGLSLGEYSALYAAGAVDFDASMRLVTERGRLMQSVAEAGPGGMVAVMGLEREAVEDLCDQARENGILTPANFNCPGQIVVSGDNNACSRAAKLAEEKFEAKATVLKVAGAFHSEMMTPAATEFRKVLSEVQFKDPDCPVVTNVDASPTSSAEEIPGKLVEQLTGAIMWQQSMEMMVSGGLKRAYEIGPGRTLKGMARRIDRGLEVVTVNSWHTVTELNVRT